MFYKKIASCFGSFADRLAKCMKMNLKKTRLNETAGIVKLSHEYNGLWEVITNKDSAHMNPAMMRRLIRFLAESGRYEMIYIMLSIHKDKAYVKTAYDLLLKDSIIKDLRSGRQDDLIKRLLSYFT